MTKTIEIGLFNKWVRILICLNSALILIPEQFKGLPITLLLVSIIIRHYKLKLKPLLDTKTFIISTAFFIVLMLSIIYSNNTSYALKKLETGLSLLVFPFIFLIIGSDNSLINEKMIKQIKLTFVLSLVFFLISTFFLFYATEPFYTLKSTLIHYTNLVDIRSKYFSIHSIYLSVYLGVAIILTINLITENHSNYKKLMYVVLLILLLFMAILNKKGPIISLGGAMSLVLLKKKTNRKQIIYSLSIALILLSLIIYLPKYNNVNKFKELITLNPNPSSSTGIRIQIYKCGIELVKKSPIIGYGWGDVKDVLDNCYKKENMNLLLKNYNSHNQYLSVFLAAGIIGLISFLYYLFFIIKKSNDKDDSVLYALTLFFIFNMFTENILEREDGIALFSFFVNLFMFYPKFNGIYSLKRNS